MVVGNHQCNAANLNQNKPQLQLELSLAQFSPSLFLLILTLGQVLLVGEYKYDGFPHLPVIDDPVELLPGLVYPVPVRTVHHEDGALSARVVMPP